jgi:hypothetical protein
MIDIRIPIGVLFLLLGAILALVGLTSGPGIYRSHSLGLDINLVWGGAMAAFGAVMLALTRLKRR